WVVGPSGKQRGRSRSTRPAPAGLTSLRRQLLPEDLDELELAALDLGAGERRQRRVPVRVERPGAKDALEVLGVRQGVEDARPEGGHVLGAGLRGRLDRGQDDIRRLVAVDRVDL